MVFVGEKAVAEGDGAARPAVAQEEVERHGRAVIQVARPQPDDGVAFGGGRLFDGVEEFAVERRFDGCLRGAEVGKIAAQPRAVVGHEGALFERRVRRDEDDGLRAARFDAPCQVAHGLYRGAHLVRHRAPDLRNHDRRVRGDADEDEMAFAHDPCLRPLAGLCNSRPWPKLAGETRAVLPARLEKILAGCRGFEGF